MDCDQNLDGPTTALMKGLPSINVPALRPDLSYTYDNIRRDDKDQTIDISECFDRLTDKLSLVRSDAAYKDRLFIGVDSLSHVNEFIVRKVLKLRNKQLMEMLYWSDFASGAYTLLVAKLEQTGKNVICTCHLEEISEADPSNMARKTIIGVNPLFSGRVGDNLGAYFTDVWLLETAVVAGNKIKPMLYTDRTPKCSHLKNSLGMPKEIDVTGGFAAIEPYIKPRL